MPVATHITVSSTTTSTTTIHSVMTTIAQATPAVPLPAIYLYLEIGILLFLIIIFSVYRTRVFSALKEFFYDIIFAIVFTGATMAIFTVRNSNLITILFFGGLAVIFGSRIIYNFYLKPSSVGGAPPPKMP